MADKQTLLTLYGALLILGGSIGYAKKGSVASLLAGGGSGAAVVYLSQNGVEENQNVLKGVVGVLFAVMAFRASKSGKFMPAGMVALLSALALGLLSN